MTNYSLPHDEKKNPEPHCGPLMQMLSGLWPMKTLAAALEFDLFTELSGRQLTLEKFAKLLDLPPRPADMLVTTLVCMGLLERKNGEYFNTPLSDEFLVKGRPSFFGGVVKMIDKRMNQKWEKLAEALKTGQPQNLKEGLTTFDSLYSDREEKRIFLECMHGLSVQTGRQLARAFNFSKFRQLMDVGGGSGAACIEVLRQYPHLNAVVYDLAPALQIAHEKIVSAGYVKQIETFAGDFFHERLPTNSDVILLSMVLHDWSPEQNLSILKKCYDALPSGGVVLVTEIMMEDDKTGPLPAALMSLNMLLETEGGCNYTWQEYTDWMEKAGFQNMERIRMDSPGANGILVGCKI